MSEAALLKGNIRRRFVLTCHVSSNVTLVPLAARLVLAYSVCSTSDLHEKFIKITLALAISF